jgi:uncharacterized protein (DUF3820 family)
MKRESLGRELVVDLPDEWLEWRALEPQPELGNAPLEQFPVA